MDNVKVNITITGLKGRTLVIPANDLNTFKAFMEALTALPGAEEVINEFNGYWERDTK